MSSQLTELQTVKFKSAFDLLDEDGDGRITSTELESVMNSIEMTISKEKVKDMIRQVDIDGNGTIDFQEFLVMVSQNMIEEGISDTMKESFKEFDKDSDGFITAEELKNVLESLGETATDEKVDKMIREVDTDNDGKISFEEFLKSMK